MAESTQPASAPSALTAGDPMPCGFDCAEEFKTLDVEASLVAEGFEAWQTRVRHVSADAISESCSMLNEPAALWLLRHGQSQGNVIRDLARGRGVDVLDIADRDMDVPLSELGQRQAGAFGIWLSTQPDENRPDVVLASPYLRAVDTASHVLAAAGLDLKVHQDERLRERELGVLDLLTRDGVKARFPDEHLRRQRLGKFYHRPPGGESWVDVALRLRSLRDSIGREHAGQRVLLITHEVVIVLMRYLMEDLDEKQALALGGGKIANCSLTSYVTEVDGSPRLELEGWTTPIEEANQPVTEEPDAPVAAR